MATETEAAAAATNSANEFIQYEVRDNIAWIWLNRPEVKNCVNWDLLTQMGEAVDRAENDPEALAVCFRGRGNTFCAGADLNMLNGEFLATTNKSIEIAEVSARTYDHIYNLKKPTIAVVEGYAVAGGFELFISTDFTVVAEDAKIGDFHIRRALFGGAGPIYRLPRYVGMRKAKELMLTGKLLSGTECYEWGLANKVAPAAELEQAAMDFCADLVDKSPFCMHMTKAAANRGLDADTNSLITLETMTCNVCHQSADAKEGVTAFLEKRDPVWVGA
ncbi:MAG TPA: enoyl-CoA hydratase/isomerase family protein [Solirubrobacterales bacterium]|nr:enoyl-CoA hydratase/isomerase family protein [Solirubrobacterales bacterium]